MCVRMCDCEHVICVCVTWGKGEVKEGTQSHSEVKKKFNRAKQKSL